MSNKFNYAQLHEGEEVIRVLHRNWFYVAQQFVSVFFLLGLFFAAIFFLPLYFPQAFGEELAQIMTFFENLLILALWVYAFLIWIDYYFDIWIVTNERLINIEQKGLFMRRVSELEYDKVQDITVQVAGFLPTVINYGDVMIQTAGETENFHFRTVSDPYKIKEIIAGQLQEEEHESMEKLEDMLKK